MINRRDFLRGAAASCALSLSASAFAAGQPSARPNIVYILADDMGYGDVTCYNADAKTTTPNMDALADRGMRFTDAHSPCAVCTPTRYAIMTGRYCWRTELKRGVLFGYDGGFMDPNRLTVADMLRSAGYATGCFGKWHLGIEYAKLRDDRPLNHANIDWSKPFRNGPIDNGFDRYFGIAASLDMDPYAYLVDDGVEEPATGHVERREGHELLRAGPCAPNFKHDEVLGRTANEATAWIRQQDARKPFFCYMPLSAPHTPVLPGEDFIGTSALGPYGDFMNEVDWTVGEVVRALDEKGFAGNTLVIVTSDNGFAPVAGLDEVRAKGHEPCPGLRGHKADIYEGGHRVPFIAAYPGAVPAGQTNDTPICLTDFMATAAELAGCELPDDAAEDSFSMATQLQGEGGYERTHLVHQSSNGSLAIREGGMKLCFCPGSGGWSDPNPRKAREGALPAVQLYDLAADLKETTNLQGERPELVDRLTNQMQTIIGRGRTTPGPAQRNEGSTSIWGPLGKAG